MFGRTPGRGSIRSRVGAALGSAILLTSMAGAFAPVLADPSSPVSVVKTASSNPVASGAQLTYTIVVTNLGGSKVNDIVLTDQVQGVGVIQNPPALPQLTMTSTKGSCTQGGPNGNLVTCDAGTLSGRQVWTVTIRGQVTAANGATLNNTASVTGTKSAQTFTTTGSVSVLVSGGTGGGEELPDLTINKTGPTSVAVDSPMTYTLTINNVGTANTANVRVVDTLPAGVTLSGDPFETTSLFDCSSDAPADPITVTCTGGAVNQGQNATIKINAISPADDDPSQITNTAVVDPDGTIEESNELNNTSATVNTNLSGPPPGPLLTIEKTDDKDEFSWSTGAGPDPVNPGEELVYKIQVVNTATSRADDVRISDTTQFLEASSIVASQVIVDGAIGVGRGCVVNAPEVVCSIRSLNAGGTMTVTIRGIVIGPAGSNIFNTATVHGNIKNVGVTNTATESTTIRPSIDLTITKDDGPDPACARTWPQPADRLDNPPSAGTPPVPLTPGAGAPTPLLADPVCLGGLTYSFVIGNSGNGDATNVRVRDVLPAGLIFDSYESTAGFLCAVDGANVVTCTGGAIDAADTETLTFMLVAPPNVGTIANHVEVDPNNAIFEPDETNNFDDETTTITTGVDLVIWKGDDTVGDADDSDADPPGDTDPGGAFSSEGFDPIATNGTQTYTIIVDNVGTQNVTGIKVRDVLPAGTRFLSFSATNGFTCTHDGSTLGGAVTCIGGHLLGTEAEFYDPPGPPPAGLGDDVATIKIKVFATPFVQPILHNEVRVDPDNEIVEVNELNNFAFQDTLVGVGNGDQGAFNQLTIDKTQIDPATAAPAPPHPPLPGFVADPDATVATNGTVVYDLQVSNLGTDPVSAIVVKDFLPTGSRFIDASDTDPGPGLSDAFFCFHDGSATGGTITCVGGDLSGSVNTIPDGGGGSVPATRIIRVKIFAPNAPGTYPNIVVVDPDNIVAEGNEFDNDDAVFTTVTVGGNNEFNDLSIDKSGDLTATPGGVIDYSLVVTNDGSDAAFNVKVLDVMPAHITFINAADSAPGPGAFSCSYSVPNLVCTGGTVQGGGGTRTINIMAVAPTDLELLTENDGNISVTLTNQAFVDPDNAIPEGNETNNSDSLNTVVSSAIDLILDKQGPGSATQNQPTTYTITVTNTKVGDGATAFDVEIVDPLPIGLIPLNITAEPGNFACQVLENPVNTVSCIGDLETEQAVTITIEAFVTLQSGTLDNEACVDPDHEIDETNELNNCKHAIGQVLPPAPDLQITKTADKGSVTSGEELVYTLTVSNVGTGDTTGPVLVLDTVPSEVTVTNLNPDGGWDCSATVGNSISCTRPDMAAGDSSKIVVTTTAGGTLTSPFNNSVTVIGGGDVQFNNNMDSVTTSVGGAAIDLTVTSIVDEPDAVNRSQQLTYTIVAQNLGTSGASPGAVVRVELPDMGVTVQGVTGTNGFNCDAESVGSMTYNCVGDFAASGQPGDSTEITAIVTVKPDAPNDLKVTVTVDPDNDFGESDETNNTLSETTTVTGTVCTASPCVDIVVADVFDSPDPVTSPNTYSYVVSIVNVGDSPIDPTAIWDIHFDFDDNGSGSPSLFADDLSLCAAVGLPADHHVHCTSTAGADVMDLGPGQGLTFTVEVTGATPGNASLEVIADFPSFAISEFSEDNNEVTESTTIVAP